MSATNCACPCPDPTVTEIPGAAGAAGADGAAGANGVNAYTTTTTAVLLIPAGVAPVPVAAATSVAVSSWAGIGQVIFISDGTGKKAHFEVLTIPGSTTFMLNYLGYPGDSLAGVQIAIGATVSPAGVLAAFSPPAAIVYTGISAAPVSAVNNLAIQTGVGFDTLTIPVTLANGGVGAGEVLTNFMLGYKFRVVAWSYVSAVVGATGLNRVFNMEINATDVSTVASTITLSAANTTPEGFKVAGSTTIAGANTGSATDTFSIEVVAGGTAFTAGSGFFLVTIQNMDMADATAHLSEAVNNLITALT